MTWQVEYLEEAELDLKKLDHSLVVQIRKAILKVSQNPTYPHGYGKPLGNHNGLDLSGLFKIKLKASGIRIVYKLEQRDDKMIIVVIGARADLNVYKEALKRKTKHYLY